MISKKKDCVTMLLAGGQGSRLYVLTSKIAKPAVPFGGKYRIIDYALSNCVNSGLDTVGVLTQYQPLLLNEYIGNGQPWDLDRVNGGVSILPPYQKSDGSDWYTGTANAVFQNLHFLERYSPEHVLILSGDHIYKMNYAKMLEYHKEKNADCTIAEIEVPVEEASRFGILNTNDDMSIYEFEEKPAKPKSTKASMGIYIFKYDMLKKYSIEDSKDETSSNDFGKNILPNMLNDGKRMFAYPFKGYWEDVGTIDSLWQANMDLLSEEAIDKSSEWKIYSRNMEKPPHFAGENAKIKNSIITEGCEIYGTVENSVLFPGVIVDEDAVVKDSVIMAKTEIQKNSKVVYSIIDENVTVGENCILGKDKEVAEGITVIARDVNISSGNVVEANVMIDSDI